MLIDNLESGGGATDLPTGISRREAMDMDGEGTQEGVGRDGLFDLGTARGI